MTRRDGIGGPVKEGHGFINSRAPTGLLELIQQMNAAVVQARRILALGLRDFKDPGNVSWHQVRLRSAYHFKEFQRGGTILAIQTFRQDEITAPVQPRQDISNLGLCLRFQLRR
jgi:hypothetical protein